MAAPWLCAVEGVTVAGVEGRCRQRTRERRRRRSRPHSRAAQDPPHRQRCELTGSSPGALQHIKRGVDRRQELRRSQGCASNTMHATTTQCCNVSTPILQSRAQTDARQLGGQRGIGDPAWRTDQIDDAHGWPRSLSPSAGCDSLELRPTLTVPRLQASQRDWPPEPAIGLSEAVCHSWSAGVTHDRPRLPWLIHAASTGSVHLC